MTPARPVVIVTRRLPEQVEASLRAGFDVRLREPDTAISAEGALIVASSGVGMNYIDLAAARSAGIVVTNTPGVRERDLVSLHVPASLETRHLIGAARLRGMRGTAFLINTARGDVVDESALGHALRDGVIAGAGIDVYEGEPAVRPDLASAPDTVLLPHLGSATVETRIAMGERAIANLDAYFRGEPPPDLVG